MDNFILTSLPWAYDLTRARLECLVCKYNAHLDRIYWIGGDTDIMTRIVFSSPLDATAFTLKYGNMISYDTINKFYAEFL